MESWDVIILGAGAAGLFCAGEMAGSGRRVLVLDHARRAGEKIRISGGGRCNFTNLATSRERFLSETPRFCASALAGYTPGDFVALVDRAGIAWHEKTLGQLFCDGKSGQIVSMLLDRMQGVDLRLGEAVTGVVRKGEGFEVATPGGVETARQVVVATGGRSIPKMGATGVGYDIARQFGLRLVEPRPGLVPLTFAEQDLRRTAPLSGVSVEARLAAGRTSFDDGLLFTHRGLSGPAVLQVSSFWRPGGAIVADLAPGRDVAALLRGQKGQGGRVQVATALSRILPERLADAVIADEGLASQRLADQPNAVLDRLGARVNGWTVRPVGSEGWRTAEVTVGGVDCRDLDGRTMQARSVPGLYFVGEVMDVTGWLGGYNFQWAWASAFAAARALLAA